MDAAIIVAIIGGIGAMFGTFLKYVSNRDKAQERRDLAFAKALNSNTAAMKEVAKQTKKAADEAAQRNGHLAEIAAENQKTNAEVLANIQNSISEK